MPKCDCTHGATACQTLAELDFERGIWGAALQNDAERVEKLLNKGVNANALDHSGYTALHYAARAGHLNVCRLLVTAGANVNAATKAGRSTALHRAAFMGRENIMDYLLENGADAHQVDDDGRNFLHKLVEHQSFNLACKYSRKFPELLNEKDKHGKSPEEEMNRLEHQKLESNVK